MGRYIYLILSGTIIGIILFIGIYIKLAALAGMIPAILAAAYFVSAIYAILFGAFAASQLLFVHKPR